MTSRASGLGHRPTPSFSAATSSSTSRHHSANSSANGLSGASLRSSLDDYAPHPSEEGSHHTLLDMTPLSSSVSGSLSGRSNTDPDDSEEADLDDGGRSSTEGYAESTARLLRGHLSDTEFVSRPHSRAASPLPTGYNTPTTTVGSSNSNSQKKSSSQVHIYHHHYHHNPLKRQAASADASTESVPDFFTQENYRNGRLARKLGFAQDASFNAATARPSSPAAGGSKRKLKTVASSPSITSALWGGGSGSRRSRRDSNVPYEAPPPSYSLLVASDPDATGPGLLPFCWPSSVQKASRRFVRLPFVPTQPLTILFTLVLLVSFVLSTTTFVIHALNNDKAPLPWRTYCQEQTPFPHDFADSLDPVNVFVGVFSYDAAYERRHLIRSTYMRHSSPGPNVQVKFILGRPRANHARRVALEMETYNDLVVLDARENMNHGKTYSFFNWAAENATVPVYWQNPQGHFGVGFQKPDYVVKADDDAFLVLSELERHLRVAPREMTYWGYLIRNLFMGGEAYALSQDLVQYIASYPPLAKVSSGAEDKKVARWMRMHPNMTSINWVTERCWIYDHPKAQTIYSHGYLFPDQVERIRIEGARGLTPEEKARRGGDWAQSWSSVSEWNKAYAAPSKDMSIEEEVEALVEGGGLWGPEDGWKAAPIPKEQYLNWDKLHFKNGDARLVNPNAHKALPPASQGNSNSGTSTSPAAARIHKIGNDLIRDVEEPIFPLKGGAVAGPGAAPRQNFAQLPDTLPEYEKLVPPPTLRYDAERMDLRHQRMLGRPHGGTVVVHFLKRHEWFLETSLALLGRHNTWDHGVGPAASSMPAAARGSDTSALTPLGDAAADAAWNGQNRVQFVDAAANWGTPRQYGSPIVRGNGYIAEGREGAFERAVKLPVDERQDKKSVWGRLRGKPKLRIADPGQDEDDHKEQQEDGEEASESGSASAEQSTIEEEDASSALQSSSLASSAPQSTEASPGSLSSESESEAGDVPSTSTRKATAPSSDSPQLVLQPHHHRR